MPAPAEPSGACLLIWWKWRGHAYRFMHMHWPRESVVRCAKVARIAAELQEKEH